jgi:hypothetical protein
MAGIPTKTGRGVRFCVMKWYEYGVASESQPVGQPRHHFRWSASASNPSGDRSPECKAPVNAAVTKVTVKLASNTDKKDKKSIC